MKKLVSLLLIILAAAVPAVGCAKKGAPKLPPARWGVITRVDKEYGKYDMLRAYNEAEAVCLVTVGDWISESRYVSRYKAAIDRVYKGERVKPGDTVRLNYGGSTWEDRGAPLPTYGTKAFVFLFTRGNEEQDGSYDCPAAGFFLCVEYEGDEYLVDMIGHFGYNTVFSQKGTGFKSRYTPALRSELAEQVRGFDPELADAMLQHEGGPRKNGLKIFLLEDVISLLCTKGDGSLWCTAGDK